MPEWQCFYLSSVSKELFAGELLLVFLIKFQFFIQLILLSLINFGGLTHIKVNVCGRTCRIRS